MNLKLVAAARTFLFNFGRGDISPFSIYRQTCHLLEVDPRLKPIPDFQTLNLPYSFFSKKIHRESTIDLVLYQWSERTAFLRQPSAVKLNWLMNFTYMQQLLFNFDMHDLNDIGHILLNWKRSNYEPCRLPFAISTTSSTASQPLVQFAE